MGGDSHAIDRRARRHRATTDDQRSPFQRDRDRILYSSAFRRLDGITQIVRAGESDIFHNRLTHTLKVAQVGRRLAERCLDAQPEAANYHGLDVEVVEAACLGHDLGHPPFGHLGENVLKNLLIEENHGSVLDAEGYEGNAQSFRIVTKLAVRHTVCDGLDLTRATLSALLKYPWTRDPKDDSKSKKWGYYSLESMDFDFCLPERIKSLEAEIMDLADDIAYSVHDLEDFHRCNLIPWVRIFGDGAADLERIISSAVEKWHAAPVDAAGRLRDAARRLKSAIGLFWTSIAEQAYDGSRDQRFAIRTLTSQLIGRYIQSTKIAEPEHYVGISRLLVEDDHMDEIRLLKQICQDYIISSPALMAQQKGQARIIRSLFTDFYEEIEKRKPSIVPKRFHHLVMNHDIPTARITADCISSLTEGEAIALYSRLHGTASGSVLDPIVR